MPLMPSVSSIMDGRGSTSRRNSSVGVNSFRGIRGRFMNRDSMDTGLQSALTPFDYAGVGNTSMDR